MPLYQEKSVYFLLFLRLSDVNECQCTVDKCVGGLKTKFNRQMQEVTGREVQ